MSNKKDYYQHASAFSKPAITYILEHHVLEHNKLYVEIDKNINYLLKQLTQDSCSTSENIIHHSRIEAQEELRLLFEVNDKLIDNLSNIIQRYQAQENKYRSDIQILLDHQKKNIIDSLKSQSAPPIPDEIIYFVYHYLSLFFDLSLNGAFNKEKNIIPSSQEEVIIYGKEGWTIEDYNEYKLYGAFGQFLLKNISNHKKDNMLHSFLLNCIEEGYVHKSDLKEIKNIVVHHIKEAIELSNKLHHELLQLREDNLEQLHEIKEKFTTLKQRIQVMLNDASSNPFSLNSSLN